MSVELLGVGPLGSTCADCVHGPKPVARDEIVDIFALNAMPFHYGDELIWVCGRTCTQVDGTWRGCKFYEPRNGQVVEPFFPHLIKSVVRAVTSVKHHQPQAIAAA